MKVKQLVPGHVLRLVQPESFRMAIYRSAFRDAALSPDLVPVPARIADLLQINCMPAGRIMVYVGCRRVRLDGGGIRLFREVLAGGRVYRIPGRYFKRLETVPEFMGDME